MSARTSNLRLVDNTGRDFPSTAATQIERNVWMVEPSGATGPTGASNQAGSTLGMSVGNYHYAPWESGGGIWAGLGTFNPYSSLISFYGQGDPMPSGRTVYLDPLQRSQVLDRLQALAVEASEDESPFNSVSRDQLLNFLDLHAVRTPSLFLLSSGNLQALWEREGGLRFSVEFLGGDEVRFVALGRSTAHGHVRGVGLTTPTGILGLALGFDMRPLVAIE